MEIKFILNKEETKLKLEENITIKELLQEKELPSETIVSKKNGEVVLEEEIIEDGDTIEFIQVIFGG